MPTEAVREPEESTAQRLGFLIFAAAILFSTVAASQLAFSHDWVKDTAIVLFAVAIRLVIVGAEGVLRRLGRCAVLAATIWLAFSAAGWAMLMDLRNDEGGPLAVLLMFGVYLALPVFGLASVLSLVVLPRGRRPSTESVP